MLVAPSTSTKIWVCELTTQSLLLYIITLIFTSTSLDIVLVFTTMESNRWANSDETAWSPVAWLVDWRTTWVVGHNTTAVSVELDLCLASESTLWSPIWWIEQRLLCCSHRRAIHLPLICPCSSVTCSQKYFIILKQHQLCCSRCQAILRMILSSSIIILLAANILSNWNHPPRSLCGILWW